MTRRSFETVHVNDTIDTQRYNIQRANLVQYAGASGDFNSIHWNERVATAVGLPNVIAHGMLSMAEAGRIVTDWVGDPGAILEYGVRFSRPVVVPDDDQGATLGVDATVESVDAARRTAVVVLHAKVGDEKVLSGARVTVALG